MASKIELEQSRIEYRALLESLNGRLGIVPNVEQEEVLTIEQGLHLGVFAMAVLFMFSAVTTTYTFPIINNLKIRQHESID